jgi:SWI/SNF-related matrix-associated actin-dependent regulator of chromatin subfamily A member 5
MAPRSRLNGNDTDVSMADAPEPAPRHGDDMVCRPVSFHFHGRGAPRAAATQARVRPMKLTLAQDVDETPDYTDSDTNPNTTASSVAGDLPPDGRKRRTEANQLRRSIFGKKHDRLGESKVRDV